MDMNSEEVEDTIGPITSSSDVSHWTDPRHKSCLVGRQTYVGAQALILKVIWFQQI